MRLRMCSFRKKISRRLDKKNRVRGLTMIETMVTMTIFMVMMLAVFGMISQYGDLTKKEHARMKLQMEQRYMTSTFTDELKNAGSVLSLGPALCSGSITAMTSGIKPDFFGIFPLNQTAGPDGIILASGDPEAKTNLTAPFTPGTTAIQVATTILPGHTATRPYEVPDWTQGDKVIVLGTGSYFIGLVTDKTTDTLTIRKLAVYYSGLLNVPANASSGMGGYQDLWGTNGSGVTYPIGAPVIRLSSFSIYLFRDIPHYKIPGRFTRQLLRITDTQGTANPLTSANIADSLVSENIHDMQISYVAYDNFKGATPATAIDTNHYFFANGSSSTATVAQLKSDITRKFLKQINVSYVFITDDYVTNRRTDDDKPVSIKVQNPLNPTSTSYVGIGDRAIYTMPLGNYGTRIMSVNVQLKNFSTYNVDRS